ncbi:ribonuclease H-like domain-containing protein [Tanacetum coccineum]
MLILNGNSSFFITLYLSTVARWSTSNANKRVLEHLGFGCVSKFSAGLVPYGARCKFGWGEMIFSTRPSNVSFAPQSRACYCSPNARTTPAIIISHKSQMSPDSNYTLGNALVASNVQTYLHRWFQLTWAIFSLILGQEFSTLCANNEAHLTPLTSFSVGPHPAGQSVSVMPNNFSLPTSSIRCFSRCEECFFYGQLSETVYMHQPPGFVDTTHPDYVCHLQRSLYGLKQAPSAWLSDGFTSFGSDGDPVRCIPLYACPVLQVLFSTDFYCHDISYACKGMPFLVDPLGLLCVLGDITCCWSAKATVYPYIESSAEDEYLSVV